MRVIPFATPAALLQTGAVVIGLAIFAFRAPERGRILLIPFGARDGAALRLALDRGAAVVAMGPFPGSIVVDGRADRLGPAARRAGVLMMAAPPSGCGGAE